LTKIDYPYIVWIMARESDEIVLTFLEQLFMGSILLEGNNAYGAQIYDKSTELAKPTKVAYGSLYPTLERLEKRGFLSSSFGTPIPERGGKARRYFQVTAVGQRALRHSEAASRRILDGLREAWGM
jgi:DNA-binding PadR family transcriptional regulator